jgi:hypothetical protein
LNLSWMTEFFYRVSAPFECITAPEISGDGMVAPVPTQAEEEKFFWRPHFAFPSDPDRYCPQLSSIFRSHLPPELQKAVFVQAEPQPICEIIVACYGRDKEWGDICVRALEKSVKRWVLDFVREALEDDWKEARNPSDNFWWEGERQSVVSPLWAFLKAPGDLFEHATSWNSTGWLRARDEEPSAWNRWSPPSSPSLGHWDAWSVGSGRSAGEIYTGWGDPAGED